MTSIKLKPIASNMTLLDTPDNLILFSYQTPVASYDKNSLEYYRTAHKWSMTTTRHINKWLDGANAIEQPQDYFDNLFNGVEGV